MKQRLPASITCVALPKLNNIEGSPATLWLSASFARAWYEDALAEARTGNTFQHRRWEIVFAVCAVESYLLEWVRNDVLSRNFTALNRYFPPGKPRGIKDRWKEVLKDLRRDDLISRCPNLSTRVWSDFVDLVNYRDGLVHAGVSRPEADNPPAGQPPHPSKTARDTLDAGWATRVTFRLISHLHSEIDTEPPEWLIEP
jgi:hypothetical protein